MRRLAFALAPLALAAAPAPAAANPADAFGFGARAQAMAGAQTAATEDGSANYYNPAALATFDAIRLDLGYQTAAPALRVNGLDLGVDSSRGLAVAIGVPGHLGPVKVALGGGLFLPDQQVIRIRSIGPGQPRFVVYDNRPQRLFLGAHLAVEIGSRLAVGGGVAYMSNTFGSVELGGRLGFPNAEDSDLDLAIDIDLVTIRYPQLGILYRANGWLTLGASYRGGFVLNQDQRVVVRGDIGAEGQEPVVEDGALDLRSLAQDLFQPEQYTAGLDAQLTPRLTLAFDLSFHRWSEFDNPATQIEIELDAGMFNDLIDLPDDAPEFPEPHFSDIFVPRLGVEWLAHRTPDRDVHLRAGYAYEPSPAPEQVGAENFVDNDKHTGSLGLGFTMRNLTEILPRPVSVDFYAATTFLPERRHRKLSPVDPVGDMSSGGTIVQAGAMSRWRF